MKQIRQLNCATRTRLTDKTLPETWNLGEEVPPHPGHGWPVSHTEKRRRAITAWDLPSPHPLTISGAAIVRSRNNFLFHSKSKRDGEQAANGSVQEGNISTKSLSLVDSVITANGTIVGDCVTQPACGIR